MMMMMMMMIMITNNNHCRPLHSHRLSKDSHILIRTKDLYKAEKSVYLPYRLLVVPVVRFGRRGQLT